MARAKTSEQSRARSKAATIEELTRGVRNLQEFLSQVEDLGREGFPYLDAARARTELQFRECIRRTFGEKSPEFHAHRQYRLLMEHPEDMQKSIGLIKTLIATLEQKKRDLQGEPSTQQIPQAPPSSPMSTRLVPASLPMVHMTITQPAPVTPSPVIMSVAMTTNLDLSSGSATSSPPPSLSLASSATSRGIEQPSSISPVQALTAMSHTSPPQVALPTSMPLHQPISTLETSPATSPFDGPPLQSSRHEPEPVIDPIPSAKPHQIQETPLISRPLQHSSIPIGATSSYREPVSQLPQTELNLVERVKTLCCRFHSVARQLRLRGEYRATLSVEDECDVQDLLHALLRVQFDNIDMDEWTPSYSNGTSRKTFLLNESRCAVIVKKTRPGLTIKDLTDELRIDAERYRSHGRCTTILCFIYDPDGRIGNPQGLETSLKSVNDSCAIEVLVSPK
jgi:REase_DpnII-MboI